MAKFRRRGTKWEYRIREKALIGDNPISKGGFRTKAEAKAEADRIEHELRMGLDYDQGEMLFTDYYDRWMTAYKLGAFSQSTDSEYLFVSKLLKEHFDGVKLKDLTKLDYQNFLNTYSVDKAKATVQKTHKKIAPCLRDAFENKHININIVSNVVFRGTESQKESEKYLNLHEAKKLTDSLLEGLNFSMTTRHMAILQLGTGMRIGEIMGLQFKDIDFLHNRIDVNKTWDYKFNNTFKPTKNKETRNIAVDQGTMDVLREFYNHQIKQKVKDRHQRLFAVNGSVPSPDSVNEMLTRACKRAGIDRVTSHNLRHTHASMLILQGADVAYISERLGHKSITITLEVYSHVLDELRTKGEEQTLHIMDSLY